MPEDFNIDETTDVLDQTDELDQNDDPGKPPLPPGFVAKKKVTAQANLNTPPLPPGFTPKASVPDIPSAKPSWLSGITDAVKAATKAKTDVLPSTETESAKAKRHNEIKDMDAGSIMKLYQQRREAAVKSSGGDVKSDWMQYWIPDTAVKAVDQSREGKVSNTLNNIASGQALNNDQTKKDLFYAYYVAPKAVKELVKFMGVDPDTLDTENGIPDFVKKITTDNNINRATQIQKSLHEQSANAEGHLNAVGFDFSKSADVNYLDQFYEQQEAQRKSELDNAEAEYVQNEKYATETGFRSAGEMTKAGDQLRTEKQQKVDEINSRYNEAEQGLSFIYKQNTLKANPNISSFDLGLEGLRHINKSMYDNRKKISTDTRLAVDKDINESGLVTLVGSAPDPATALTHLQSLSKLDEQFPEQNIAETKARLGAELYKHSNKVLNGEPSIAELDAAAENLPSKFKDVYDKYVRAYEIKNNFDDIPTTGFFNKFDEGAASTLVSTWNTLGDWFGWRSTSDQAKEILNQPYATKWQDVGEYAPLKQELEYLNLKQRSTGNLSMEELSRQSELKPIVNARSNASSFLDGMGNMGGVVVTMAVGTKGIGAGLGAVTKAAGLAKAAIPLTLTGEDLLAARAMDFGVSKAVNMNIASGMMAYSMSYDDNYKRGLELFSGKNDEAKRKIYASTSSALFAMASRIFKSEKVLDAFMKRSSPELATIVNGLSAGTITKQALPKMLNDAMSKVVDITKEAFKSNVKISSEMTAINLGQSLTQYLLNPSKFNASEAADEAVSTFTHTFLSAPLVSVFHGYNTIKEAKVGIPLLYKVAANDYMYDKVKSALNEAFLNNTIDKATYQEKSNVLEASRQSAVEMNTNNMQQQLLRGLDKKSTEKYFINKVNEKLNTAKSEATDDEALKSVFNENAKKSVDIRKDILNRSLFIDDNYNILDNETKANERSMETNLPAGDVKGTPYSILGGDVLLGDQVIPNPENLPHTELIREDIERRKTETEENITPSSLGGFNTISDHATESEKLHTGDTEAMVKTDVNEKFDKESAAIDDIVSPKPKEDGEKTNQDETKVLDTGGAESNTKVSDEAPPKVITLDNAHTVDAKDYERPEAKEVARQVKNILSAIHGPVSEDTGAEPKIVLHDNSKSFESAIKEIDPQAAASGSKGAWVSKTGEIHLDMSSVTSDTLNHEAFHPLLNILEKNNPGTIDKLHEQLGSFDAGKSFIETANQEYDGDVTKKKEAITDFIAHVADGKIKLDKTNIDKIKEFINRVLNAVGLKGFTVDKPIDTSNAKELRDLAKMISGKFKKGVEVKASELGADKIKEGIETITEKLKKDGASGETIDRFGQRSPGEVKQSESTVSSIERKAESDDETTLREAVKDANKFIKEEGSETDGDSEVEFSKTPRQVRFTSNDGTEQIGKVKDKDDKDRLIVDVNGDEHTVRESQIIAKDGVRIVPDEGESKQLGEITRENVKEIIMRNAANRSFLDDVKNNGLVQSVGKIGGSIAKAFHPFWLKGGNEGRDAAMIIRKRRAREVRDNVVADEASKKLFSFWNKQKRIDNVGFMISMENPKDYGGIHGDQLRLANAYKDRMDKTFEMIAQIKDVNFIEDYFPHFWKDPVKAKAKLPTLGKTPLEGNKSFLKQRFYENIYDGLQAGLTLATYNPEEMVRLAEQNALHFKTANDIFKDLKKIGLIEYFSGKPDGDNWVKIDDPMFSKKGAFINKEGDAQIAEGAYYANASVAAVLNNFTSKGLFNRGDGIGSITKTIRHYNNIKNTLQLGAGLFHFSTTTLDATVTGWANALKLITTLNPGNMARGLLGLAKSIPIVPNLAETFVRGYKANRDYLKGDMTPDVRAIISGGGRVKMQKIYALDAAYKMKKAWHNFKAEGVPENFYDAKQSGKDLATAAWNALWVIPEKLVGHALMSVWVPALKTGGYLNTLKTEMLARPNMDARELQKIKGRIWDSMDNRLGQVVYDNVFWDKTIKDLGFMSIRSLGWTGGTIKAFGTGFADAPKSIGGIGGRGIEHTTAWMLSLPIAIGAYGALYQYMMTGKKPDQLEDYFFPKDGTKNDDGTDHRVSLPSYMKDIYAYSKDPGTTASHKLSPFFTEMYEMFHNKDFYGQRVYNPDDPWYQKGLDVLKYQAKSAIPFSLRENPGNKKESTRGSVEKVFGVMPAAAEFSRSDIQNAVSEETRKNFNDDARTKEQTALFNARHELKTLLRGGTKYADIPKELKAKAKYPAANIPTMVRESKKDYYGVQFKHLKPEQQLRVWAKMSDEDKKLYGAFTHTMEAFMKLKKTQEETFSSHPEYLTYLQEIKKFKSHGQ